eukprot:1117730-Amphidinium_carterae.1
MNVRSWEGAYSKLPDRKATRQSLLFYQSTSPGRRQGSRHCPAKCWRRTREKSNLPSRTIYLRLSGTSVSAHKLDAVHITSDGEAHMRILHKAFTKARRGSLAEKPTEGMSSVLCQAKCDCHEEVTAKTNLLPYSGTIR